MESPKVSVGMRPDNVGVTTLLPPEDVDAALVAEPTDADIDDIETRMLAEIEADEAAVAAANTPPPAQKKSEGSVGRPPRKDKLIADVEKFRGSCPDIIPANWKLKKTRIKDLEIILARCVSAASGHPLRPNTEATDETPRQHSTEMPQDVPDGTLPEVASRPLDPRLNQPGLNGKTVAGTMVDLNVLAMEIVEFGTQCASPYTDGVVVSGASAELRAREKELEDIIRNVYADNKEICDKFVSPTLAWASLMTAVALKNVKKIDPTSGEVLSPQDYVARQKARSAVGSPQ